MTKGKKNVKNKILWLGENEDLFCFVDSLSACVYAQSIELCGMVLNTKVENIHSILLLSETAGFICINSFLFTYASNQLHTNAMRLCVEHAFKRVHT